MVQIANQDALWIPSDSDPWLLPIRWTVPWIVLDACGTARSAWNDVKPFGRPSAWRDGSSQLRWTWLHRRKVCFYSTLGRENPMKCSKNRNITFTNPTLTSLITLASACCYPATHQAAYLPKKALTAPPCSVSSLQAWLYSSLLSACSRCPLL